MVVSSLFLVSILYVLANCEIPGLNVRKLDRDWIAKKRHDTLEMCRVFTEENAKIQNGVKIIPSYKRNLKVQSKMRVKREVMKFAVNPALKEEDERRVEDIVDKLYDEMEQKGVNVTYRHNIINSTTTQAPTTLKEEKKANRRYFFAPEFIEGPLPSTSPPVTEKYPTPPPFYQPARWKHGILPYFIDPKTYDAQLQQIIMKAFEYMEKATCIRLQRLRERPTDQKSLREVGWIYITNPSGIRQCVHSNEKRRIDGVQMMVLGYDCMTRGDIVHEVMHILGFSHEHTRVDRDHYITILWDNIKHGYKWYFDLNKDEGDFNQASLPYDYASVMHYPPRAFSRNGKPTIVVENDLKIGQREGLSELDVHKVGLVYSGECVDRNRDYLLKTCPSVVKSRGTPANVSESNINKYFKDRLWPLGVVSYKFRDSIEFSLEEILNLKSVFAHIEKETCIKFVDASEKSNMKEVLSAANNYDDSIDVDHAENQRLSEIIKTQTRTKTKGVVQRLGGKSGENQNDNEIAFGSKEKLLETKQGKSQTRKITVLVKANSAKKDNLTTLRRVQRQASFPKDGRRHSKITVTLRRTAVPGCQCPSPGKQSSDYELKINADCFNSVNDLLHVFVHVLGLDHQHNTYDRDNYLHIVWRNLDPDVRMEMEKKLPPEASVGFPYDYQSVMHYPWLQIKDGLTNIMYPIWNDGWGMGHWQGLSYIDVQKLNRLYNDQCEKRQQL